MPDRSRPPAWPRQAADAVRDLRGALRLGLDAARAGLDRAEAGHLRLAAVQPPVPGARRFRPGSRWGAVLYRTLRGTAEVGAGALDLVLGSVQASLMDPRRDTTPGAPDPARDSALAALNALVGDHLHGSGNPLALPLRLFVRGDDMPATRVLVLLHDLGRTPADWAAAASDATGELAGALQARVIEVQYNSGRRVAETGRELAAELQALLGRWRTPPRSLVFIGHGLGGLVARSAWHEARALRLPWADLPAAAVFLGTPHAGAPALSDGTRFVAKGGLASGALLALARLGGHRSAGLQDFGAGWVLPADRRTGLVAPGNADAGLLDGMQAFAIAGDIDGGRSDGLVPVASALARQADGRATPALPESRCWVAAGVDHAGLPASAAVWSQVRHWLSA